MKLRTTLLRILLALCLPLVADAAPWRVFAVGDLPYGTSELAGLRALFAHAVGHGSPFLIHVGDIKSGSQPCTDAQLAGIAGLFAAQPVPVVYTPGDNEWTDCHRLLAGSHDPLRRLARVRAHFFEDPAVLRLGQLGARAAAPDYPELYRFVHRRVMFVVLHVVGSHDGARRADPRAQAESAARRAVNRALLREATDAARTAGLAALVVVFHVDPLFERRRAPRALGWVREALAETLTRFPGPVLALHGDTHRLRHDRPLQGGAGGRLVRVEVPGSPSIGGVWITIDPTADEPFQIEPVWAQGCDLDGEN
ncbi:hypothetical protein MARPU_06720 [Marichromatium purpuratum 984]|uniref:Calcineurin-like phosphoesterase domain-containing protein n=1 Tax=Marichromatium purpuratum 984 TaxID=765910 RepID=W0E3B0_MARPU|nr:hypothetical protein [Marichromatium purpuratum]AHF03591.1 hypothetical protein MARPU_06720 [Marichromatium purpuratum 984]